MSKKLVLAASSILILVACTDSPTIIQSSPRLAVQGSAATRDSIAVRGGFSYVIPSGYSLLIKTGDSIQVHDPQGALITTYGPVRRAANTPVPGLPDHNWITFAEWTRPSGQYITWDSSSWVVPPLPQSNDGQIIFLFNGLQNPGVNAGIIQPVLMYNYPDAFWTTACFYVDSTHNTGTLHVRAYPGDTLVGTINGQPYQGGPNYTYGCDFYNLTHPYNGSTHVAAFQVNNAGENTQAVRVLEGYVLDNCADFPNVDSTRFRAINVRTNTTTPNPLSWTDSTHFSECHQHTSIVSTSNPGGSVDLYYNPNLLHIDGPTNIEVSGAYTYTAQLSGSSGCCTYRWYLDNFRQGTGQSQTDTMDATGYWHRPGWGPGWFMGMTDGHTYGPYYAWDTWT